MSEIHIEVAVERDWCLRSLISQAEGRTVDNGTDSYLIEQLNASHVSDVNEGHISKCQIGGCVLRCLTTNEQGILGLIAEDGQAACGY